MKIRCPLCHKSVDEILMYSHADPRMMCIRCAGKRYNQDRHREMTAEDLGIVESCEWWVLVDPRKDRWMQVTEKQAGKYAVAQCRMKHAISASMMENFYDC